MRIKNPISVLNKVTATTRSILGKETFAFTFNLEIQKETARSYITESGGMPQYSIFTPVKIDKRLQELYSNHTFTVLKEVPATLQIWSYAGTVMRMSTEYTIPQGVTCFPLFFHLHKKLGDYDFGHYDNVYFGRNEKDELCDYDFQRIQDGVILRRKKHEEEEILPVTEDDSALLNDLMFLINSIAEEARSIKRLSNATTIDLQFENHKRTKISIMYPEFTEFEPYTHRIDARVSDIVSEAATNYLHQRIAKKISRQNALIERANEKQQRSL